jgi:hypothetical protein
MASFANLELFRPLGRLPLGRFPAESLSLSCPNIPSASALHKLARSYLFGSIFKIHI